MELKDYKKTSQDYSAKASEIARQVNFAGIGIIWIIKTSKTTIELNNCLILVPLILISISLLFDFAQYLIGSILWIYFYRTKEKAGVSKTSDVVSKPWRSNILYVLYYIKFALMIVAYIFIIKALFAFYK